MQNALLVLIVVDVFVDRWNKTWKQNNEEKKIRSIIDLIQNVTIKEHTNIS